MLPVWPVAVASPDVFVAVPVLLTVLSFVALMVTPLLAPFLAPPVADLNEPVLAMSVLASPMPSPEALPEVAVAISELLELTVWLLLAVVAPAPPSPEPELAPPAASTVVTVPRVVLLPSWPVAVALPDVFIAVPLLVTVLVSVRVVLDDEFVAFGLARSAPPLVLDEPMVFVMLVSASPMPSPEAFPVLAVAESSFKLDTV